MPVYLSLPKTTSAQAGNCGWVFERELPRRSIAWIAPRIAAGSRWSLMHVGDRARGERVFCEQDKAKFLRLVCTSFFRETPFSRFERQFNIRLVFSPTIATPGREILAGTRPASKVHRSARFRLNGVDAENDRFHDENRISQGGLD
jgi:hypothetical protein